MARPRWEVLGVDRSFAERIERLLMHLALLSEGRTAALEPGHGQPGSRPPAERFSRSDRPPPQERSLADYWAWKFEHARDDRQLRWYVLLAEEELIQARQRRPQSRELAEERKERLLAARGSPMEVAARMHINEAHVITFRQLHGRDPDTGEPLPDELEARLELAREMKGRGLSERDIARRAGVPRSTLQRHLR